MSWLPCRPVADPGFPVGRRRPRRGVGVPTPKAVTFQKFCMSKQKNLGPFGGGGHARQLLDQVQPFNLSMWLVPLSAIIYRTKIRDTMLLLAL